LNATSFFAAAKHCSYPFFENMADYGNYKVRDINEAEFGRKEIELAGM